MFDVCIFISPFYNTIIFMASACRCIVPQLYWTNSCDLPCREIVTILCFGRLFLIFVDYLLTGFETVIANTQIDIINMAYRLLCFNNPVSFKICFFFSLYLFSQILLISKQIFCSVIKFFPVSPICHGMYCVLNFHCCWLGEEVLFRLAMALCYCTDKVFTSRITQFVMKTYFS